MPTHCPHCGEELMGAVNRCWRCGQQVLLRPGMIGAAVREAPQPAAPSQEQATVAPTDDADEPVSDEQAENVFDDDVVLAEGVEEPHRPPPPAARPAARTVYPKNAAAVGGAIASVVLGIMALVASFYTSLALVLAALGLGMGIWGAFSTRRNWAFFGMLLCCLALAIASYFAVVELFTQIKGYSPWAPNAPVEEPFY